MTAEQRKRIATAVGFLSGVLACLDALRDTKAPWPPDLMWSAFRPSQRLEFGSGVALILITLALSIVSQRGD